MTSQELFQTPSRLSGSKWMMSRSGARMLMVESMCPENSNMAMISYTMFDRYEYFLDILLIGFGEIAMLRQVNTRK